MAAHVFLRNLAFRVSLILLVSLFAAAGAHATQYPPGPGGTCPDSVTIARVQNPAASCHPAAPDTVLGVRGIITAIDKIPTTYAFFIQNTDGGPWSGINVSTGTADYHGSLPGTPTGGNLAVGDSVVIYGSLVEFQSETEIQGPDGSNTTNDLLVRKISSGNPLPPFHVGTTHDFHWIASLSAATAEPFEGCRVRVRGPLQVARVAPFPGSVANSFLVYDPLAPSDSILVDGGLLTSFSPPPVGTYLDSLQGVVNQRTTSGISSYCIAIPDSTDAFIAYREPCNDSTVTYTTNADFGLGTLDGVVATTNQLELPFTSSLTATISKYAWIANSGEGTVSKVNTLTGNEEARYYTGPPDMSGNYGYLTPSRTTVDKDGNCWVANRCLYGNANNPANGSSVTEILAEGGIDRNSDGSISTSSDGNGNGIIGTFPEILPWGQDERVVRHYLVGGPGGVARGLAIDKKGFVWVGLHFAHQVLKLKPDESVVTYAPGATPAAPTPLASVNLVESGGSPIRPYGLALAPNGFLYGSSLSSDAFEIDPGVASGGVAATPYMSAYITHTGMNYGVAVDRNCIVWLALINGGPGCVRWDPSATTWSVCGSAPGPGRGITVDGDGNVWMACNDAQNSVCEYSSAGVLLHTYTTTLSIPVGVGIASDGNVMVIGQASGSWVKLDKSNGTAIALAGPKLTGFQPYTYSDFTGSSAPVQKGYWDVITDALYTFFKWQSINWNGSSSPPATTISVQARASQTLAALATTNWTTLSGPGPLTPELCGRYLETRVHLEHAFEGCSPSFATPILYDLTAAGICDYSCPGLPCPGDITVPCTSPAGAVVNYSLPPKSNPYAVTGSPPPGSLFPIGQTVVHVSEPNPPGPDYKCSFIVNVTGDCLPTPVGGCCDEAGCTVMTEAACLAKGGQYLGDGSDCANGCHERCTHPPGGLVGWWPLDGISGGKTPNLADAGDPGYPIAGPTSDPLYVHGSLVFNGTTQYVNVPNAPTLAMGTGNFSVDAWVHTTQATGLQPIIDKRDWATATVQGYSFFLLDGYPGIQLAVNGQATNFVLSSGNGGSSAFVADGAWHHVAVTVQRNIPTGIQFYVNGSPKGTPLDPTSRPGSLDNANPLLIGKSWPHLVPSAFFHGGIDEVELFQRKLRADEVQAVYAADSSGKCHEGCYVTSLASCCNGSAKVGITLCNYTDDDHTYSWGVSSITNGPGCGALAPTGFDPPAGTTFVPKHSCVTIPVNVACPTGLAFGQNSCFQVSVFDHNDASVFGCLGSVHLASWWCLGWKKGGIPVTGLGPVSGFDHFTLVVSPTGNPGQPSRFVYRLSAVSGHEDSLSDVVSINGHPVGQAVVDSVLVPSGGGPVEIPVDLAYTAQQPIGFDRILVESNETGPGLSLMGELGVEDDVPPSNVTGVPMSEAGGAGGVHFLALPNPFGASTKISFTLPEAGEVGLSIFDVRGRTLVELLDEAQLTAGPHTVDWDGKDGRGQLLPAGLYFVRLESPRGIMTMKITLHR